MYEKLAFAPEIESKKAYCYVEWIRRSDAEKIEAVIPIRWTDGNVGFEISILEPLGMLNVTTVTVEQINDLLPLALAEAASIYNMPYSTLAEFARDGKLAARQSGKTWITTPGDIEAMLEKRSSNG